MDANNNGSCTGCSQIFIAIDPYMFGSREEIQEKLNRRVKIADNAHPIDSNHPVKCPGESTITRRKKSMSEGVQVDDSIFEQVKALAEGREFSGRIE